MQFEPESTFVEVCDIAQKNDENITDDYICIIRYIDRFVKYGCFLINIGEIDI